MGLLGGARTPRANVPEEASWSRSAEVSLGFNQEVSRCAHVDARLQRTEKQQNAIKRRTKAALLPRLFLGEYLYKRVEADTVPWKLIR